MQSFFITKSEWQKGSNESNVLGQGALVGVDTYSKKGVLRLAKKSSTVTQVTVGATGATGMLSYYGTSGYPTFFEITSQGSITWAQLGEGSVINSTDGGNTWNDTAFPTGATGTVVGCSGNGLIGFQDYLFAFANSKIYFTNGNSPTGGWTDWTDTKVLGDMNALNATPINAPHFPFLFPNNRGVYFCNGGSIGFFGQNGTTAFSPTGVTGTDFLYNGNALQLPSLTYVTTNLNFLPPNNLAIVAYPYRNPTQDGVILTWDTVSPNKFSPPLRIFGNSLATGAGTTGGIKQIYNRNQVLYIVAGGNHAIYETNASSWNLLEDIGLYSSVRDYASTPDSAESDLPVFYNSFPAAITILGNKLLTGTAPLTNAGVISTYPPASYGIFPVGVWSVAFLPDGSHSTQCEFSLPVGNSTISPSGSGNYAKITALAPVNISGSSTNQIMVGYTYKAPNSVLNQSGIALVDMLKYIDNINYVSIESPLYEIGTALNPETVSSIEINLVKNLLSAQTIDVYYRTSLSVGWTAVTGNGGNFTGTFTGDNTSNFYQVTDNNIGKTQFIQFRVRMATTSDNPNSSPEIRSVKIT